MLRSIVVACAIIATLVSLLPATSNDAYSSEGSAFSVTHPKIRHYWDHRGGIRVLGNPISRQFLLLGTEVQILQYGVIQHRINADWGLGLMNILDEGMLPYTHIGGLTLPAPDPELTNAAPSINDPDYAEKAGRAILEGKAERGILICGSGIVPLFPVSSRNTAEPLGKDLQRLVYYPITHQPAYHYLEEDLA